MIIQEAIKLLKQIEKMYKSDSARYADWARRSIDREHYSIKSIESDKKAKLISEIKEFITQHAPDLKPPPAESDS